MEKRPKQEKRCQVLKMRQAGSANQWDSVESDTESLAQERAYQQQLQMGLGGRGHNAHIPPQRENADRLLDGGGDGEDLHVYDSLEVVADHAHAKRNSTLLWSEYLRTRMNESERTSQLLSDDAYADLRYDPNWRTNLKGAGRFNGSPQISVEEHCQVPEEKASQSRGDGQGTLMKGGYRYITDTSLAVVVTPGLAGYESDQPYRLHPRDGQTSSVTPPHCHNHASQRRSPESDLSAPSSVFTKSERHNTVQRGFREKQEDAYESDGENDLLTEDIQAMHIQGSDTYYQQKLRRAQGGPTRTQQTSASALTNPNAPSNRKLELLTPTEDIVERNKITLGRNTSKCGSYVTTHALKQEMPPNANKISKGKKGQWKENPNPPQQQQQQQQQQPPARGVRAERGDRLSSPSARPAGVTQLNPQKTTSLRPRPLTILGLDISLDASSRLLPLLRQKGQDAIVSLASRHGCPRWSPAPEAELALSPEYPQSNPGQSSWMSRKGGNAQLHHRKLERSPEQCQRRTASKWPLPCDGEDQKWSPDEVHSEQLPHNLPRTPTTTSTSSLASGPHAVLPPIGKPVMGKEPEPCVNTAHPVRQSSSDGYLVQMEKRKQLRTRVVYKAYSLKDHRQLKSDIYLRGLGPDYVAIEKTRLYSDVIREQNKKISRIPFLLAKDPEGNDKKVPRIKALEYAKTIARPPVQSQPKQSREHQSEGFAEHAPYLEGLDVFLPATLEVLRKRHEEEKRALALFGKVHAV